MSSTGRILEITPLLPWRPASLSPSEILRFWADVHPHELVHAGRELVTVVARQHANVDHLAGLAVRHLEAGVADLAGLLTEDRSQEPLLGRELGLALRRDLADEDVAGADLGADADDPARRGP